MKPIGPSDESVTNEKGRVAALTSSLKTQPKTVRGFRTSTMAEVNAEEHILESSVHHDRAVEAVRAITTFSPATKSVTRRTSSEGR